VTFACTFLVYVLFTAVVYSNGDAYLRFVGPDLSFSELFLGERVTHGIPLIVMCCFSFANADDLRLYLRQTRAKLKAMNKYYYPLLVCYWYMAPLALIGIYSMFHEPWSTYKSRLSYPVSFAIASGTVALCNSIPLYVFLYKQ
jgi:hypothetical protein